MNRILVTCTVALFMLPALASGQSTTSIQRQRLNVEANRMPSYSVYEAQFKTWPVLRTGQGYVGAEGYNYALEATGNTWMGTGKAVEIAPLPGDFILDIGFNVVFKVDCSINITVSDAGRDYSQLDFFFDMWQNGQHTFSIYENAVQSDFYVTLKRKFAEREQVNLSPAPNWKRGHLFSIRRQRTTVSFLLDGRELRSFQAPQFTVRKLGIGIANKSKILLTSVRAKPLR